MRSVRSHNRVETFEQWRQRMLDETGRFIEWGLENPEKVEWIPMQPVARGGAGFSERLKTTFWSLILRNPDLPE
jgi:hypothetical protein